MKKLLLCASMFAGISAYSQGVSIPVFLEDPQKNAKTLPYSPNNLRNESGAIVHATLDQGLNYLVNSSRTSRLPESWAFIPKYEFWINISKINPLDSTVVIDNSLRKYALSLSDSVDIFYTHNSKDYDLDVEFKPLILEYGEIMRYLPTPEDNFWMLSLNYSHPKNKLSFGIASNDGILKMTPDSLLIKNPSFDHDKLNDLAIKMTVQLAEFYKQIPVREFKNKSKDIEGIISIDFIPYKKD